MLTRSRKENRKKGAYLYRKDRKKSLKKTNEGTAAQSSEDGSSGGPARMDTDEGQASSSSEDESSTDGEYIPVEITPTLKELLKNDSSKIVNQNMLHKLPCEPNVASILEMYFKHFTNVQMCSNTEKSGPRNRNNPPPKRTLADIHKTLLALREFLDGVRIYFDNYVNVVLLYKEERGPNLFPTSQAVYPSIAAMNPTPQHDKPAQQSKKQQSDSENGAQKNRSAEQENQPGTSRKKSLRSYVNRENQQTSNGTVSAGEAVATSNNSNKPCSSIASSSNSAEAPTVPTPPNTITWKALPDFTYNQRPPPPCLVYGATHLARLMVKIPEILALSAITEEKLKGVVAHLNLFIEYLSDHSEWFGDKYYRAA